MKKILVLILTFLSSFPCAFIDESRSELPSLNEDLETAVEKEEKLPSSDNVADDELNNYLNYMKYVDFNSYEHFKSCESKLDKYLDSDSESEYDIIDSVWKEEDRPDISIEVFKSLSVENRLPAYIRYITNIPVSNNQVVSRFIKENVLNHLDLTKIFVLYEIEMMDVLHSHDTEAVIESHLKTKIFSESNENMADLAFKLFDEGYDKALKLVIDRKFSYNNIYFFKDLFWLLNYAKENYFPEEFNQKVLSFDKSSVVRKYVDKSRNQIIASEPNLNEIEFIEYDTEELDFKK